MPHFCSEFKRHFGESAIQHLIRLRLQHAVYLLRDENLRIGEVAEQTGYEDLYYFSKLFNTGGGGIGVGQLSRSCLRSLARRCAPGS